jgi:tripartite-type tricarboxylate transporter receptor subunit TctC
MRDFVPVSRVADLANVLVVNPSVPANSVRELIAYAKSNPNALNYSSAGSGTSPHLSMELFRSMAGVNITHVPYKGTGPAVQDLIAGQVQVSMVNLLTGLPHIKSGKLRALGTTGSKRVESLPSTPTIAEAGLRGYEANQWYGLFAPSGTPPVIVNLVQAQISRAVFQPDVQRKLETDGAEGVGDRPEEFAIYIRAEFVKWTKVVKAAGITSE